MGSIWSTEEQTTQSTTPGCEFLVHGFLNKSCIRLPDELILLLITFVHHCHEITILYSNKISLCSFCENKICPVYSANVTFNNMDKYCDKYYSSNILLKKKSISSLPTSIQSSLPSHFDKISNINLLFRMGGVNSVTHLITNKCDVIVLADKYAHIYNITSLNEALESMNAIYFKRKDSLLLIGGSTQSTLNIRYPAREILFFIDPHYRYKGCCSFLQFDLQTFEWIPNSNSNVLINERFSTSSIFLDDNESKLMVIGGFNTESVELIDLSTPIYNSQLLAPISYSRGDIGCCQALNSDIYIGGGNNRIRKMLYSNIRSSVVYFYNQHKNNWYKVNETTHNHDYESHLWFDDNDPNILYIFGHPNRKNTRFVNDATVEWFDLRIGKFNTINLHVEKDATAFVFGKEVLLSG